MRFFQNKAVEQKLRHRLNVRCTSDQFDLLREVVRSAGYDHSLLLRAWQQQIIRQGMLGTELLFSVEFDARPEQSTQFLHRIIQRTTDISIQSIGLEVLQDTSVSATQPNLVASPKLQRLRAITRPRTTENHPPRPHQPLWGMLADQQKSY